MQHVKLYQPDLRVTLYKTRGRTSLDNGGTSVASRFADLAPKIELTSYLAESGGVRTSKSVRDAAGGFSLTFADKPYSSDDAMDTLAGIIEPMDFIEIRMRHDPPDVIANLGNGADPSRPPVIMRGFVSDVTRSEFMGQDGKPQRTVIVAGQDYGKLWQMLQILYLPGYVIGEDIISGFKLFERFGVGFQTTMTAADFVTQVVQKIINPYIAAMMPANTPNPTELKLDVSVKHGTTSITGPQNQEGMIYDLLRTYGDVGIWNELYVEDREDGVFCVYRPVPALDLDGNLIQADATAPQYFDLDAVDVLSLSSVRSDAGVANYYWVRAPRFELVSDIYRQQFAIQGADKKTVQLDTYQNTAVQIYGTRVMYADTQQGGDDVTTFSSGQTGDEQTKRDTSMASWINDRRKIMVDQNKDNVLLERGSMRIRGNENIRAGMYVRLTRGAFVAIYYIVQVDHDYIPFQGFFSTLIFERGTGFVSRVRRSAPESPYLAELESNDG